MLQEKKFLASLYQSNSLQARRHLAAASNSQLRLLMNICYCIANGKIHLPANFKQTLLRSGRGTILHKHFATLKGLSLMLKSDRKTKIEILEKFTNHFNKLLF